jgi:hypothetical protein
MKEHTSVLSNLNAHRRGLKRLKSGECALSGVSPIAIQLPLTRASNTSEKKSITNRDRVGHIVQGDKS